jgi:hypothetical protein
MTDAPLFESVDLHGSVIIGGRRVRIDITTDDADLDADLDGDLDGDEYVDQDEDRDEDLAEDETEDLAEDGEEDGEEDGDGWFCTTVSVISVDVGTFVPPPGFSAITVPFCAPGSGW